MSRTKLSMLLLIATVVATIAAAPAVAETIGSSYYANTIAALNPEIHLRLSEPAGRVVGDPLINDGSLGAGLAGTWGAPGYSDTAPISGVVGPRSGDTINGRALLGLEDDNTAVQFGWSAVNSKRSTLLNLSATYIPEVDQEDVTYSLFIKNEDTTAWPRILASHPNNSNRFLLSMSSGMLTLVTATGTGLHVADSVGSTFNDGQWHHVVAIRNGDDAAEAKLYVDGEEVPLTIRSGSFSADFAMRSGAWGTGSSAWTGVADEIAIWGRALSGNEVDTLFQAAFAIPEPSSLALLAVLLAGAIFGSRRKG